MRTGVLRVSLVVPDARTLKEKRRVVKSLKDRLRNTFNISAAEVDAQDIPTRAVLGISLTGTDSAFVQSVLDKVLEFINREAHVYIVDHETELI